MKKKILIITSYVTGHGHKSITGALEEELKTREDIEYKTVEGFELGGKLGVTVSKMYAPLVCKSKKIWKLIYKTSERKSNSTRRVVATFTKRRLNKLLDEYNPDLVITVHPVFNGSVLDVLKKRKREIPMIAVFADLISIPRLWIDSRLTLSIAPTSQASVIAQKSGVNEEKIKVIKLPVRKEIADIGRTMEGFDENQIKKQKEIRFLIMSGGEGAGNFDEILNKLLQNENFRISIITGTNTKLKEKIEKNFKDYLDRITVYGYVKDIGKIMANNDIGIVRGSPNVLMECISCLLPVIINGTLPGQEEGNVDFILLNKLGVLWHESTDLSDIVDSLIKNDKEKLIEIKRNQLLYRDLDSAKKIIDEIEKILNYQKGING